MTVGGDEAAVKADVARLAGRDGLKLRGDQVFLGDAVLPVEKLQNAELEAVAAFLAGKRLRADENIQALARDRLVERLFALLTAEMRQKIVDDELRIVRLAADMDLHALTA